MNMTDTKRIILLIGLLAVIMLTVTGVTIGLLYGAAIREERVRLVDTAKSQARLMESVARFDAAYPQIYPDGPVAATISQVLDAHEQYEGFGDTGEFTLARREGDNIAFLLSHQRAGVEQRDPIPFAAKLAEPMRRALSGLSGTIIGPDYRGVVVLAAYEPVAELDLGIVAKINLAEIRSPFVRAGAISAGVAVFAILLGTALFVRVTKPIIHRLVESEERFRDLYENAPNAYFSVGVDSHIRACNRRAMQLLGYQAEELVGRSVFELYADTPQGKKKAREVFQRFLSGEKISDEELQMKKKDGTPIWISLTVNTIRNKQGDVIESRSMVVDITQRKRYEEKLTYLARHDPLTGVYNRHSLDELLEQEVKRSQRYNHPIDVLMVDVNRFKEINDRFGHQLGDRVLQKVAQLLTEQVRGTDIVARYGGDEFLIILPETDDGIDVLLGRIRGAVARQNRENPLIEFPITLAIGSAHWEPGSERSLNESLHDADQRMYEDKAG